ncbi:unnamed protein product [Amoebophrya sp. A120]|nr:unnamed protein product [Amoebophrya sp. A120]|eukprot:GSA120T00010606001.1
MSAPTSVANALSPSLAQGSLVTPAELAALLHATILAQNISATATSAEMTTVPPVLYDATEEKVTWTEYFSPSQQAVAILVEFLLCGILFGTFLGYCGLLYVKTPKTAEGHRLQLSQWVTMQLMFFGFYWFLQAMFHFVDYGAFDAFITTRQWGQVAPDGAIYEFAVLDLDTRDNHEKLHSEGKLEYVFLYAGVATLMLAIWHLFMALMGRNRPLLWASLLFVAYRTASHLVLCLHGDTAVGLERRFLLVAWFIPCVDLCLLATLIFAFGEKNKWWNVTEIMEQQSLAGRVKKRKLKAQQDQKMFQGILKGQRVSHSHPMGAGYDYTAGADEDGDNLYGGHQRSSYQQALLAAGFVGDEEAPLEEEEVTDVEDVALGDEEAALDEDGPGAEDLMQAPDGIVYMTAPGIDDAGAFEPRSITHISPYNSAQKGAFPADGAPGDTKRGLFSLLAGKSKGTFETLARTKSDLARANSNLASGSNGNLGSAAVVPFMGVEKNLDVTNAGYQPATGSTSGEFLTLSALSSVGDPEQNRKRSARRASDLQGSTPSSAVFEPPRSGGADRRSKKSARNESVRSQDYVVSYLPSTASGDPSGGMMSVPTPAPGTGFDPEGDLEKALAADLSFVMKAVPAADPGAGASSGMFPVGKGALQSMQQPPLESVLLSYPPGTDLSGAQSGQSLLLKSAKPAEKDMLSGPVSFGQHLLKSGTPQNEKPARPDGRMDWKSMMSKSSGSDSSMETDDEGGRRRKVRPKIVLSRPGSHAFGLGTGGAASFKMTPHHDHDAHETDAQRLHQHKTHTKERHQDHTHVSAKGHPIRLESALPGFGDDDFFFIKEETVKPEKVRPLSASGHVGSAPDAAAAAAIGTTQHQNRTEQQNLNLSSPPGQGPADAAPMIGTSAVSSLGRKTDKPYASSPFNDMMAASDSKIRSKMSKREEKQTTQEQQQDHRAAAASSSSKHHTILPTGAPMVERPTGPSAGAGQGSGAAAIGTSALSSLGRKTDKPYASSPFNMSDTMKTSDAGNKSRKMTKIEEEQGRASPCAKQTKPTVAPPVGRPTGPRASAGMALGGNNSGATMSSMGAPVVGRLSGPSAGAGMALAAANTSAGRLTEQVANKSQNRSQNIKTDENYSDQQQQNRKTEIKHQKNAGGPKEKTGIFNANSQGSLVLGNFYRKVGEDGHTIKIENPNMSLNSLLSEGTTDIRSQNKPQSGEGEQSLFYYGELAGGEEEQAQSSWAEDRLYHHRPRENNSESHVVEIAYVESGSEEEEVSSDQESSAPYSEESSAEGQPSSSDEE